MDKRKIIIFDPWIYDIGGSETWLYNLTTILAPYFDVLVLYEKAAPAQLERLKVPHEQYGNHYEYQCDILLNLFNGKPYKVKAGRYLQVIHQNLDEMGKRRFIPWEKIDGYIFVSEEAKKHFPAPLIGKEAVILENPIARAVIPASHKGKNLRFMAATRLTREKGGVRIAQFIKQLHEAGEDFTFEIWTTAKKYDFVTTYSMGEEANHLIFHPPQLDLRQEMVDSDYVCQFSDCESFCYTIYEALNLRVPVLVTDWDGVRKAVRNGLNGYVLDMDMSNVDIRKIKNPPHTFGVIPNSSRQWVKYLNEAIILPRSRTPYHYFPK